MVILFPVYVLLAASIPFSSGTILFLSSPWYSWLRILVLGALALLVCFIVSLRGRMRHPALWFNAATVLFALGLCAVAWDYLPEEHFLRVRFGTGSVSPTLSKEKSRGPRFPWYANNKKISANTFIWKQQFSGKECPLEKKDGEIRVFVMGGSQAWGSGAASTDEMFSELIEKKIRAGGLAVTVYNAGVNGARIHNADTFYHQVVRLYKPDILLLSYGVNDNAALRRFHGKPAQARRIDEFARRLEHIIKTCEEEGTKIILSLAAMSRENLVRPNKVYYEKLEEIADAHGIPVVKAYKFFAQYERDQMVWWDMAHFAPPGHKALANLLAPVVENAALELATN
jgi:lysophospholipase L1-like esterase